MGPEKTETRLKRFFKERFRTDDPEYAAKMLVNTLLSMRMHVLVGLRPVPTPEELARHAERTVAACLSRLAE